MIKKTLEQENIFEEIKNGTGNLLINAKAGTGKTTTIVNSLDLIGDDKTILLLAFNKHIANELKERIPQKNNIKISTTHSLGWGAIRRKYKNAVLDEDKAIKVIRRKAMKWNMFGVKDVDKYLYTIKSMVDLCRVTLTTKKQFVVSLAKNHAHLITDEDARRILSIMEAMYNDINTFDFIDMIYIPAINNKVWLFPNDYVFVDECIDGRNTVLTNHGYFKISDLYDRYMENEEMPMALSYNMDTGENEFKKITTVYDKGDKEVYFVSISKVALFATESHLFKTMDGWRETKDLKKGDLLLSNEYNRYNNSYYPNDEQVDFMSANLICNNITILQNSIYKFRIYIKNKEIAKYDFINKILPLYVKSNKDDIKMTEYSTTKFYLNSTLFNKEYIIKNITPKQLAITYIISGKHFADTDKYGFYISVKTFDEVLYVRELFQDRFNQDFEMQYYIKGWYLVPVDQNWFFNTVSPFIPGRLKRIVPLEHREKTGVYKYIENKRQEFCGVVSYVLKNKKKAKVYDISVEDNNNYFMSSIYNDFFIKNVRNFGSYLVHNCQDYNRAQQYILNKVIKKDSGRLISVGDENQAIYAFNGSDSNAFNWFRNKENTKNLSLSTSFRCPKNIIRLAQKIVPDIKYREDAEDGEIIRGSVLELAQPGDFVLSRKNQPLVVLLFDLLNMDKISTIRGNDIGIGLIKKIKKYKTLDSLNEGLGEELNNLRDDLVIRMGITDYDSDPRYVSLSDNVEIIRYLVTKSKSVDSLLKKIGYIFSDNPKGIILSSIHKSKGLEADNVFIINPNKIRLPTKSAEMGLQEKNLEYIAYTRAKKRLILDVDWRKDGN